MYVCIYIDISKGLYMVISYSKYASALIFESLCVIWFESVCVI